MRVVRVKLVPAKSFTTGKFPTLTPTTKIVTGDIAIETAPGHTALIFVKRAVDRAFCDEVSPVVRQMATVNRNRAAASGPLNQKTLTKIRNHPGLRQVNPYAYVQYHPGKYTKPGGFRYANSVESGTVGWVGNQNLTKFTSKHFDGKYQVALRLAAKVDARFKAVAAARHRAMVAELRGRPKMSPAFTTMAANFNFRTALHRDNKTMEGSMLVFTLLGDDKAKGGLLMFPQLDTAVDLRVGDMLAFDAELLHGNTTFQTTGHKRLSCVFYNRVP